MKLASFKREHRLVNKEDFSSVFSSVKNAENGRLIRSQGFAIYQKFTESEPRLGLSIPKRVLKQANQRNRVKRVVREFFRQNRNALEGDIVVRLMKQPASFDFEHLVKAFRKVLVSKDGKNGDA